MNNVGPLGSNERQMGPIQPAQPTSPSGAASVAKETLSALASQTAAPSSPIPAATQLSLPIEETKEQAIKNRDGHLWQCVDRISVEEGSIYKFMLRKEFDTSEDYYSCSSLRVDEAVRKNKEIAPAVEMRIERLTVSPWNWYRYHKGEDITNPPDLHETVNEHDLKLKLEDGEIDVVPVPIMNPEANEVLLSVGYKLEITKDGIHLYLPDENVLESRWNKMVDDHPERKLKKLSILSSRDIAADEEFTKAFIDQKLILSTGSEFAHDHQLHILPALGHMLMNPENYSQVHEKYSEIVAGLVEQIKKARVLILENILKANRHNAQEGEYYKRLEKNMVLADTIPSIVADHLAATHELCSPASLDAFKPLFYWIRTIHGFANFVEKRHANEISEKYQKEHNGVAIPPAELAAQMEGISLRWLFEQITKILDEQDDN